MFNQQFSTQKLLSEYSSKPVVFDVNDPGVDELLYRGFESQLDYTKDEHGTHYVLSAEDFEKFIEEMMSDGYDPDTTVSIHDDLYEMSATGGGAAPGASGTATFVSGFGDATAEPAWGKKKIVKKVMETESEEDLYSDWDQYMNPERIVVHLNNGKKLEISKANLPGGKKVYSAVLQAFIDDRKDITNKVIAAILNKTLSEDSKDVEPKYAAGKAKVYAKNKWGWKDAPSIPNRPSKGGFEYKSLWEASVKPVEPDADYYTPEDYQQATKLKTFDPKNYHWDEEKLIYVKNDLGGKRLSEAYSKFKKETAVRDSQSQMHEAIKHLNKKVDEVNRMMEYALRLKEEMESQGSLKEYKRYTTEALKKTEKRIAELYSKYKKLK